MINTKTNQFAADLSRLIEKAELPPVNIRLVLQAMEGQMMALEQQVMVQECAAAEKERKEAEKAKAEGDHSQPDHSQPDKPHKPDNRKG
ncbi:MAG: hypothetical protein LUH45_01425 [Clostridiales bacterium]|nr:hypothetical protein [Clostridiales bacterium]